MTPNIDLLERMKVISQRINSGRDSYAGREAAWHNLGVVKGKFTTWKELLTAAKADFEVIKKQLEFAGVPVDAWGTFRVDDIPVKGIEGKGIWDAELKKYVTLLGSVGEDYQVIQHTSGFELLDLLVNQVDGAHYDTMGILDYGGLIWGQVDTNLVIQVGDDVTKIYLTLHTSHNGTKAFDIFETGVREVCRNTFRLGSLKRLAATLRVKHTKNSGKRIENLKTEIQEIKDVAMTMQERLNFLAKRKVTKESLNKIMDRLFPLKKTDDGEESSTRRDNILGEILGLYDRNDGNVFPEQRGTAYNLLNAVTEYTDHYRSTKSDGRAESAVFGSGDKLKTTALQLILDEAERMPEVEERIMVDWKGLGLNVR